jgi:hypothetical protein
VRSPQPKPDKRQCAIRPALEQVNLGLFYSQGRGGLPKDDREAARLFELSADREDAHAQVHLGLFYSEGRGGLPKDDREAARLYKLAADKGNALGQHNLGSFYRYGRGGLPKDDQEAARLFKPAADQGNAWAKAQLASFEAARLYKLVADQGSPWVQRQAEEFFPPLGKLVWCPHGVFAGQYGNRCGKCVHEQKEIEEKQRRERELLERQQQIERELQERQQRINAAAESLQRDERSRLASSLIPSIEELRSISPQDFDDEIARMFERLGYEVKQTPYVNDHGRDAILVKDGKKFLLECKRYGEGNVSGRRDLQILHSNIIKDRAVAAFFVTTGGLRRTLSNLPMGIR